MEMNDRRPKSCYSLRAAACCHLGTWHCILQTLDTPFRCFITTKCVFHLTQCPIKRYIEKQKPLEECVFK